LSSRGAGHRVHCEVESFLTCYKHTFMSGTCQRHALQRTDISWWATRLIMTAILIRARSVVQVHPGPPLFSMAYRVLLQKPQPTIQPTRYCTVLLLTPSPARSQKGRQGKVHK